MKQVSYLLFFFLFSYLKWRQIYLKDDLHQIPQRTDWKLKHRKSERHKLEKELQIQQDKGRSLHEMSEKLKMELICVKSHMNG